MRVIDENFLFPLRHIPPCFSNKQVIDKLDVILNSFGGTECLISYYYNTDNGIIKCFNGIVDKQYGFAKGTEPIQINLSKPNGGNRIISIPNPVSLLPIHFYINEHCNDILNEQEEYKNYFLSSSYFFSEEGQILTRYNYDDWDIETRIELKQKDYNNRFINSHKICDGKYYHLAIDISNFYNNIYTHTISWNLKNIENKKIFENLDILTRTMNFNETKGILIGPYTSSLFAEIILSKVDRAMAKYCKEYDVSYIRYSDDYDFYCDSKETLENIIKKSISENLSIYKLDLNIEKMKLEEFPFISLNTVHNKDIFLFFERIKNSDYKNSLEFIESIMKGMKDSLKIKYSNCNYFLKLLIPAFKKGEIPQEYINDETSEILLDFLINMMFKNNLISANVSKLIITIISKTNINKLKLISKWINKCYKRDSHLKEITDIWLLYLILNLDVNDQVIDDYALKMLDKGDIEMVLALEYFHHNNKLVTYKEIIKEKLDEIKKELKERYDTNWIQGGYYSKYWLLFYINSTRWKIHYIAGFKESILNDMDLPNLNLKNIKQIKLFKFMYDNRIELLTFDYD